MKIVTVAFVCILQFTVFSINDETNRFLHVFCGLGPATTIDELIVAKRRYMATYIRVIISLDSDLLPDGSKPLLNRCWLIIKVFCGIYQEIISRVMLINLIRDMLSVIALLQVLPYLPRVSGVRLCDKIREGNYLKTSTDWLLRKRWKVTASCGKFEICYYLDGLRVGACIALDDLMNLPLLIRMRYNLNWVTRVK